MNKFLLLALILCQTLQAYETNIIDRYSENKMQVINDVLNLQKALLLDFNSSELPAKFAENGFLSRQMKVEYLVDLLEDPEAKIIAVYQDKLLVGYLLLCDIQGFFDWATGRKFDSAYTLDTLQLTLINKDILYIEQIGVMTSHAKQGIGKTMVDIAKTLSPNGLLSDILHVPFINHASLSFFTKQKFSNFGILDINDGPDEIFMQIYIMLWSPTE